MGFSFLRPQLVSLAMGGLAEVSGADKADRLQSDRFSISPLGRLGKVAFAVGGDEIISKWFALFGSNENLCAREGFPTQVGDRDGLIIHNVERGLLFRAAFLIVFIFGTAKSQGGGRKQA